jgi:diguanylate cyclase (GGDEF)-like protein/PAS domain S-box-containing protein
MPDKTNLSSIFIQTLEQAIDAVVVINADNIIILYNQAAEKLWGLTKAEVIGQNVKILVPDNIKPNHDSYVNRNRDTGENKIVGSSRDIEITRSDGSKRWGSFSISKVEVDGEILYTSFVKDVTEFVHERERIRMLSLVTDRSDNAIFITDSDWKVVYINSGFTNLFGYSEAEVIGKTPISMIAPYFSLEDINDIRSKLMTGKALKEDKRVRIKDGQELWCSVMSNSVYDEHGNFTNTVTILSEITATKLHEVLHAQVLSSIASDKSLEIIMDVASQEVKKLSKDLLPCIFKFDEESNLKVLSALDFPREFKRKISQLKLTGDCKILKEKVNYISDVQHSYLWRDFKSIFVDMNLKGCWTSPVKGEQGESIGLIAFFKHAASAPSDIESTLGNVLASLCGLAIEREMQRQKIRQLAYYDSLTHLPNRSLLLAEAESSLREAELQAQNLAVLFLDVDRFKQFNDTYGAQAGDFFLKEIASRLSKICINGDFCGRLSADEFVIIAKNKTTTDLANFIDEIKLVISKHFSFAGNSVVPSLSIGVSVYPEDGHDIGTLVHRADIAMNQAKSSGQGRFSYFSHELNQLAMERQELEIALQEAIKTGHLKLVYQPQIRIEDGSLYGVEALARWDHPKFGEVSPGTFIPLAEEGGLIGELSRWALKAACQQMSEWRAKKLAIPVVSVNLSPENFHSSNLCQMVLSELEVNGLQPSDITLELTEGVLLDTNPNTMKTIDDIHSHGIGFSLDDFGTGYSSLSYLRKIPIRELKLDKSFIMDIESSDTSQALSQAVIQIGESLALEVVAEGVETAAQFSVLKEQGYHVAQGYLFAKPLNPDDLESWLEKLPMTVD